MGRRTIWIAFFFMVILGALAVCTPQAKAETGWARLSPQSDTYVKWRVAFTMPDHPRPEDIAFFLPRKQRAIERARDAHIRWVEELEAARAAQQRRYGPPPHQGPINWLAIADCESGDHDGLPPYTPNWSYNGSSGFDGGLQFLPSTWVGAGGRRYAPYAWQATPAEQIAIASTLSLSNWPYCQRYA
jgi:hypothetical protein